MVKPTKRFLEQVTAVSLRTARLLGCCLAVSLAGGCSGSKELAEIVYTCETSPEPSQSPRTPCGQGDPKTEGMEPSFPTEVCQTLLATRFASDSSPPDETDIDTPRIQAALDGCPLGGAVKLVTDGSNNAFVASTLQIRGRTLWVDAGVTLYGSRNPELYQLPGNTCGKLGVNDSKACANFIEVSGVKPAIMGDGVIDGQGGEPLIGHDYSWWEISYALREVDGSIGNPTLINLNSGTSGFILYRITLHNSAKFHVKLTSVLPPDVPMCTQRGQGFTVWGITILTPSKWLNSRGVQLRGSERGERWDHLMR